MKFLVVVHALYRSGGLLRFERIGRQLRKLGHQFAYLVFEPDLSAVDSEFDQLTFEEAQARTWDITMVPGQGFPDWVVTRFGDLQAPAFGLRVQHILNDTTFAKGFLRVNGALSPDLAVFNNRHWTTEQMAQLKAPKRVVLEGAVDTSFFVPPVKDRRPVKDARFVIGSQVKAASIDPFLEMMLRMPKQVELRLFNMKKKLPDQYAHLIGEGRVKLLGKLDETALRDFYHGCDCVVHYEKFAGWANIAAEAMACGVPVICTRPGTAAFAEQGKTAIMIDRLDADTLEAAVRQVGQHPGKAHRMAARARDRISAYDWRDYTQSLLSICRDAMR